MFRKIISNAIRRINLPRINIDCFMPESIMILIIQFLRMVYAYECIYFWYSNKVIKNELRRRFVTNNWLGINYELRDSLYVLMNAILVDVFVFIKLLL
jgi:hypothetical protein